MSDAEVAVAAVVEMLASFADAGLDLSASPTKLREEAAELEATPCLDEWADVAVCLIGTAMGQQWSPSALADALLRNVDKNTTRTWVAHSDGTWHHREEVS